MPPERIFEIIAALALYTAGRAFSACRRDVPHIWMLEGISENRKLISEKP